MSSLTLQKRRLYGHLAEGKTFANLDLRSSHAFNSVWRKCIFTSCDFSASNFTSAQFIDCIFTDCTMMLTAFNIARFDACIFSNCTLEQANFTAAILGDTAFDECRMTCAVFFDAMPTRMGMTGCNLHGADLRFLYSGGVDFQGSNLWGAQVGIGCGFFNGSFDDRQCRIFLAMIARRYTESDTRDKLREMAGKEMALVERLMREQEEDVE